MKIYDAIVLTIVALLLLAWVVFFIASETGLI